jgi:uncharacterized membrane protein
MRMSTSNRATLFWGLLLIVVGVGFLLNSFRVIPGSLLAWWPVLVLGAGVWLVGQGIRSRGSGLVGGVVLLALGTFWLLENFGRADSRLFVPVLLISVGAGLLLRSLAR